MKEESGSPPGGASGRKPHRAPDGPPGRTRRSAPRALGDSVEETLARSNIPGCSVAVVASTGPLWADGFGFADVRRKRPAKADTVYHLFSGTKLFTAVAVLQLVERGAVELDGPVAHHVPDAMAAPEVTVRHLLSHQSGLKDRLKAFLAVTFPPDPLPDSAESLSRFPVETARPPGRRVEYRNVNYALLGELVSRVSGIEYRDYVRWHVLDPLGMVVDFRLTEEMRARAATGYLGRWDPMRLALRVLFPDVPGRLYGERVGGLLELREYYLDTSSIGGLVGSAPEFGKFLHAQLTGKEEGRENGAREREDTENGNGEDGDEAERSRARPCLTSASIRRMQGLVAEGAAGIESRVGTGLGWKIGRVDGRTFLNHEGGGAGFTSELRLYPAEDVGVAVMMNMMRMPRTMRAAHRICEAVVAAR